MNCEEYEILLSARLDGALTPEETARMEAKNKEKAEK